MIDPSILARFEQWRRAGYFDGSARVLEIGAQEVFCADDPESLNRTVRAFGREALPDAELLRLADHGDAADFYRRLGFEYAAVDSSGERGALALDLNYDRLPEAHHGRYGVATNFGTTEHVANQLNVFQVMHDATEAGGYMIHQVICTGELNHGLVNYNPKMFWMLAKWNFYEYAGMWMNLQQAAQPLPANILDLAEVPDSVANGFRTDVLTFFVILRKEFNAPFVPPLDGEIGGLGATQRRRYWTHATDGMYERIAHLRFRNDTRARREIEAMIRKAT